MHACLQTTKDTISSVYLVTALPQGLRDLSTFLRQYFAFPWLSLTKINVNSAMLVLANNAMREEADVSQSGLARTLVEPNYVHNGGLPVAMA
jgi:hypothetical protein